MPPPRRHRAFPAMLPVTVAATSPVLLSTTATPTPSRPTSQLPVRLKIGLISPPEKAKPLVGQ
ncbi:hypothetical protein H310_10294 [Aphanomyces invadans]|uniref:Uncharacterized protein n=1 Tax=Aphanomyces invadans TaxID=157072 RepID=A0A024TRE1_9STRA|nr:hypothetical protein H310_10294 [Aphanomyces invadans]ETV96593.1 hypothetical protein H310_10294 [Aphanomyces invadans]|eukprot:XP_008874856.1 hypothetical protein H310_10294 [Aphanomyces invadans]